MGSGFNLFGAIGDAEPQHVLVDKRFSSENGTDLVGTMNDQGAVNHTISTQYGQYTIPQGYHNGNGRVNASYSNLSPGNIKKGVNIGGVVGTLEEKGYTRVNVRTADRRGSHPRFFYDFEVIGLTFSPKSILFQVPDQYVSSGDNSNNSARGRGVMTGGEVGSMGVYVYYYISYSEISRGYHWGFTNLRFGNNSVSGSIEVYVSSPATPDIPYNFLNLPFYILG